MRGARSGPGQEGSGGGPKPRLAWGLFGLILAMIALALILRFEGGAQWGAIGFIPVTMGFAAVGAVVAARTSNTVGWLFLAEGLALALPLALREYAARSGGAMLPGAPWAGWVFTIAIAGSWPPLVLALLLFPDGRLASARWRLVAWVAVATGAVGMTCAALGDVNFSSNFPRLVDPVTVVHAASLNGIYNAALGLQTLTFPASAVALILRLRRSRSEERLQLKWFVYATVLSAGTIAIAAYSLPDPALAYMIFAPLIPIGAGVAIFKYRLYDIDVVINKTLVYAALAAFITAVYVGIVVGIGQAIGSTRSVGLSILATSIVALGFQPVRNRVQHLANRLVYGRRATPYEVLSDFSERMSGAYATDDLLPRMARILAEGTGAATAVVWLKVGSQLRATATWPHAGEQLAPISLNGERLPAVDGVDRLMPVNHHGELLGALSVTKARGDPLRPAEEKLMEDLASGAGLVLRGVRLTEELLERLRELQASRARIVAAQDSERRKLERNLHDGAQQQLVALQVKLSLAERLAEEDCRAKNQLASLKAEAGEALENLRDLARGIYPPLLQDQGIAAALASQARKVPVPVTVEAERVSRYPQEIEAAVYFCCLEALQNVAKYAGATNAVVRVFEEDRELAFTVTDDGKGFDYSATSYGTGLQGMADRLAALGGALEIRSSPGAGTTVTGRVPVETLELVG